MLAGIVAVAAGTRYALPHLTDPARPAGAVLVAGGVTIYLLALAAFRAQLGHGPPLPRVVAAVLAPATIPIGTELGTAQQLVAVAVLIAALLVVEHRLTARTGPAAADPAG